MGSANQSKQSNKGSSFASGISSNQAFNQSQQGSSTLGGSASSQDVWGAQSPALQQLYGQASQLMQGQGQFGQGAQQVAGQAQNAWLQQLTPGGNPYFERSVQGAIDQATQGFTRGVLPELEARGVGLQQYGGVRDSLARGEAAGLFGQGLANQVGGMYANQYAGDQQRALAALGMGGQIQGMQTAPLTTAAGLIGGPAVLGQSNAFNQGSSFGSSVGTSSGQSINTAQSKNAGSGGSMGVGVAGK